MGFLVGKSLFIEGLFARIMYRSLYKMHQAALHGGTSVAMRTIGGTISQRPASTVITLGSREAPATDVGKGRET